MSQSNVMLNIGADVSKAVKGLLDTKKAEDDLAKSTTGAALAGRDQAKAQTAVNAALDKTTAATKGAVIGTNELREAIAKKKREDKDAAGFAKVHEQAMDALTKAERARARAQREAAQATREGDGALAGSVGTILRMASAVKGVAAAGVAAAGALSGLHRQWQVNIEQQERANKKSTSMKDFVSALPEGPEGVAFAARTSQMGAKFGLTPDQTAALAGPLMAANDKDGDGKLKGREVAGYKSGVMGGAMLQAAGVTADDATNVILAGDNQGVGGVQTASKLMKASEISMRGPEVFSKSAAAISQYENLDVGLSVATALSKSQLNPGLVPQAVSDVNMALSSAADEGEFAKNFGLAGLSQEEKIAKLRSAAAASGNVKGFTDDFVNQGLDESKAKAVGMLISQGDLQGRALEDIRNVDPGYAHDKVKALETNPITASGMAQEKAVAAFAHNDIFGPNAEEARTNFQKELALGAELQRHGGAQAVDAGTAMPKEVSLTDPSGSYDRLVGTAKAGVNGMPILGRDGAAGGNPAQPASQELAKQLQELNKSLMENNKLLARNNAVTEQNNARPAQRVPVGGAATNAEEKY